MKYVETPKSQIVINLEEKKEELDKKEKIDEKFSEE